jgi:hemerythrin-like domain-containing protein
LTTRQTDIFTLGATHMAHIHNAILRGYNSIYIQAPYVTNEDKPEFIGYAQAWFRFVKSHHDDEELELFPKVEEVVGSKDIWNDTHKEHGAYSAFLNTGSQSY